MNDANIELHQAENALDNMHHRFNALAQMAGKNMPRFLVRKVTVPVTIMLAAGSAAGQARFDNLATGSRKGTLAAAGLALAAYAVGFMSKENPDAREGAFMAATALGGSAASVYVYDQVTATIATQTAPAPAPTAAPAPA